MADATILVGNTPIQVTMRGGQGPMGPASGPLGAGSVTAANVSNDAGEQNAIATKLRVPQFTADGSLVIPGALVNQLATAPEARTLRAWVHDRGLVPQSYGAAGNNTGDDTSAITTTLAAVGAAGGYRVHFPYGGYPVSQFRLNTGGVQYDLGHAVIHGTAAAAKKSIMDIRCGAHSWVKNGKLYGNFNANYECGAHHYTNDLDLYYPGWIDVENLHVEAVDLGLCIGALPSQGGVIGAQTAHMADDIAINAPLSELTYTNLKTVSCPKGLRMEQPNGKVTIMGGRIHTEPNQWASYYTAGAYTGLAANIYAVEIASAGSELTLLGGTVEHVQGGDHGACAKVLTGTLNITDAIIETTVPHYIAGTGVLRIRGALNNGLNSSTRSYVEVHSGATGTFSISDGNIYWPNAIYPTSAAAVRAVDGLKGANAINLNFTAEFERVRLVGAPFNLSGATYRPLVRGVRSRFRDCEVSGISGGGVEQYRYRLHDGDDILRGKVDRNGAATAAYSAPRATSTIGGWTFTIGGNGGYGFVTAGLPAVAGLVVSHAIKILSSGGGGTAQASTPNLNPKRDGLNILRGFIRTDGGAANLLIRANFLKFDGAAASTASTNIFFGQSAEFGTSWQPLLLAFVVPADCEIMTLDIYCENGAWAEFFEISIT